MKACGLKRIKAVKYLLDAGADVNRRCYKGLSAMDRLTSPNRVGGPDKTIRVLKCLLQSGRVDKHDVTKAMWDCSGLGTTIILLPYSNIWER